jgi:osmoprotectant transport system permease protein
MNGFDSWLEYMSDERDDVLELTIEHATIVLQVMASAIIFSVVVGVVVQNRPALRNIALSIASVFLTIPSLALFTLFIPVFGIGKWPVRVALFMYALLPILRNTVTGLDGIDPAVEESAKGMGMSPTRRLFQVKLPLAWPVIVTGIRVAFLLVTGIAAIATLVNGGGLGDLIKVGFNRLGLPNSMEPIWAGTVMVIVLALTFDFVLALLQKLLSPRVLAAGSELPSTLISGFRSRSSSDPAHQEGTRVRTDR